MIDNDYDEDDFEYIAASIQSTERDELQCEEGLKSLAPPLQPKPLGLLGSFSGWEHFRGIELASP